MKELALPVSPPPEELQSHKMPDHLYNEKFRTFILYFILTMPPKQTTDVQKANIAKARETMEHPETQSDLASALAVSQQNLANAKTQVTSLELAVENLQATCASPLKDLDAANSKITDLNVALQAEHDHSKDVYQHLRTECCAWQHSDKQKEVLARTIAVLRETTETQLQKQKELEKSVASTESEIKQVELSNSKLQAELLSNVQLFDLALSRELLSSSQAALRGSKSEVYNLK